jgi:hypothetical protein
VRVRCALVISRGRSIGREAVHSRAASRTPRARLLAADHAQRVLIRRSAAPRAHHQRRQPPRPPAADRSGLAPPTRTPTASDRRRAGRARLAGARPALSPPQAPHRARQTLDRCESRDRTGAHRVPVGRDDRAPQTPRPPPPTTGSRRQPPSNLPNPSQPLPRGGAGRRVRLAGGSSLRSMRSRLATLVRGSSRPDTVLWSRLAHLRVTVVVVLAPAARPPTTTMTQTNDPDFQRPLDTRVHLRPIAPPIAGGRLTMPLYLAGCAHQGRSALRAAGHLTAWTVMVAPHSLSRARRACVLCGAARRSRAGDDACRRRYVRHRPPGHVDRLRAADRHVRRTAAMGSVRLTRGVLGNPAGLRCLRATAAAVRFTR